jgi:hypothetical protein
VSIQSAFGYCRDCKAPVMFAKHKVTGRANRFDINPHENGNALLDRQRMRYEFLAGDDLRRAQEQKVPLFICYAATCSNPPKRHGGAARRREVSRL